MRNRASEMLEVFENPRPERRYTIEFTCREFTSLCPLTGQPDFATIVVRYIPCAKCVELKSLKYYLRSFRDTGAFFEEVTNRILDDLVQACSPVEMVVAGRFNVRGGIEHEITAEYSRERGA